MKNTMKKASLLVSFVWISLVAGLLIACANPSPIGPMNPMAAQPRLEFIDLENFDRDLNASLGAQLTHVDVLVVNSTTASAIPPRLQAWLHAVEAGGGTVKVSPPHSTVSAKNPLLLLSLVSGIWNSIKVTKAVQAHEMHKPARAYDAEIVLKIDDKGERLIDKILFTQKKTPS
jgi:hypothetical protein